MPGRVNRAVAPFVLVGVRLKPNAFRKFADVRNLLYISREIGTYAGDVDTCPTAVGYAHGVSRRVAAVGGRPRGSDDPTPRAGASRACRWPTCWPALTFHVMQNAGTLAEHFSDLFDDSLADSSWADRRARVPWAIFAELMRRVLRPKATAPAARRVLARAGGCSRSMARNSA